MRASSSLTIRAIAPGFPGGGGGGGGSGSLRVAPSRGLSGGGPEGGTGSLRVGPSKGPSIMEEISSLIIDLNFDFVSFT